MARAHSIILLSVRRQSGQSILKSVDWIKTMMIAVATGGPRINEVKAEFGKKYDEVAEELASRGVRSRFPYRDLCQWYERWSSGDMPSWQSRRNFINDLADDIILSIREASTGIVAAHEPTGWKRVDRTVTEARNRLASARTEEQFQAVGLLCREILISLAQAVFDSERHLTLDG